MSRRPKTALLVGVAVVLLAAGCGDAGESSEVPETTTTTTTVAAEPAS
jgi:ABC-type glycerol-3-phosphate transport system substrate-binding protein